MADPQNNQPADNAPEPGGPDDGPHMPTDVSHHVGFFDRFAERSSLFFSRAPFFSACVLLVVLWLPSYFLIHDVVKWELLIHTVTAIITFLMVALLQNGETRSDQAVQGKLNALAAGLATLMAAESERSPELRRATQELRQAVGLEEHESS